MHDQLKSLLESGYIEENMINPDREDGVLSDTVDGRMYRRFGGSDGLNILERLSISWNFDGLPIYKSSSASLWPILVQLNELKPSVRKEEVLMCGLWFGSRKPLWATYCKPFMEELTKLSTIGITWHHAGDETRVTKVISHAIVCDAPARCMVQGTNQFNGAFGCAWCLQRGTVIPKGNGFARIYKNEPNIPVRSQENVISSLKTLVEHNLDHHNGVKAASPLLLLPEECGVDVVRSFSVDYMHAVLLGVVRYFLDLWFGPKWSSSGFSVRSSIKRVDARLLAARPPQDISRTPRTLLDAKTWKASECRNWLLYYSVPALYGILPTKYLDHWCLLVDAIYMLLQDKVKASDVVTAEIKLRSFSKGVESLYGEEHMTSNMHALLHLGECVKDIGPLWSCSAFPFEGFMMQIQKFFSGTTHLPQQVADTFLMLQELKRTIASPDTNNRVSFLVTKWLGIHPPVQSAMRSVDGAIGLSLAKKVTVEPREMSLLTLTGNAIPSDAVGQYVNRAIIGGSVCCTERYGSEHKRNSFTLFTKYGVGRIRSICFVDGPDGIECFIFIYRSEVSRPTFLPSHIVAAVHTDTLMVCRPADVECNAVVLELNLRGRLVHACARQPNPVEKD